MQIMWALAGLFLCIQQPNDARVFLLIYSLTSLYFTGVMVRLMLVLAPALVLLSSIAISQTLFNFSEMAQVLVHMCLVLSAFSTSHVGVPVIVLFRVCNVCCAHSATGARRGGRPRCHPRQRGQG